MSLASTYAASAQATQAEVPAPFSAGPLSATVLPDGNAMVSAEGFNLEIPATALVALAAWVNATFT